MSKVKFVPIGWEVTETGQVLGRVVPQAKFFFRTGERFETGPGKETFGEAKNFIKNRREQMRAFGKERVVFDVEEIYE